jgi:hypothetical protein
MLMKMTVLLVTYDRKLTTRTADESKLIQDVNYFGLVVLLITLNVQHIKMRTEWLFLLTNYQSLRHRTFNMFAASADDVYQAQG